jgi:hypothetical protein
LVAELLKSRQAHHHGRSRGGNNGKLPDNAKVVEVHHGDETAVVFTLQSQQFLVIVLATWDSRTAAMSQQTPPYQVFNIIFGEVFAMLFQV